MVTIHDVEQGSDAWQELRRGLYTGSNAHKLLKYGATQYSATQKTDFTGSFWTKRGHLLEEEAIELYERITRTTVERPGFITNDQFPDCGYSPDGIQEEPLIEVKCFDIPQHLKLLSGDISLEILAQIHFGMTICERKVTHLLPYNPKLDPKQAFKIIRIPANRTIKANFKKILTKQKAQK